MITITIIIIIIMHNRFLTIGAPFRVPPFWARIWTPNLGPQFRADLDSSTNQHESANTFTLHAANIYMCIVLACLLAHGMQQQKLTGVLPTDILPRTHHAKTCKTL